MGVMSSLLNLIDCFAISYPPIYMFMAVCQNLCQCRCPTAASDNAELHSKHFDEQQIYNMMIACFSLFIFMSPTTCCYHRLLRRTLVRFEHYSTNKKTKSRKLILRLTTYDLQLNLQFLYLNILPPYFYSAAFMNL